MICINHPARSLCYSRVWLSDRNTSPPGTHAPVTGHYEELNIFGTPTGGVEHVREGERLPHGPRGFTWRQIDAKGC